MRISRGSLSHPKRPKARSKFRGSRLVDQGDRKLRFSECFELIKPSKVLLSGREGFAAAHRATIEAFGLLPLVPALAHDAEEVQEDRVARLSRAVDRQRLLRIVPSSITDRDQRIAQDEKSARNLRLG